MSRTLRKMFLAAALLPLLFTATLDSADAAQRGRNRANRSRNYYGSHNRYWNGYWGWYGRSYRPYYNTYYYRGGYAYPGFYGYGYGYGYPYYGNSVGVQIGGLTIGTWY